MTEFFSNLTVNFFHRAFHYTGSLGDFRFRFVHDDNEIIHAAVYTKLCYEKADDVEDRDFPWTEEGVEELKQWLEDRYQAFLRK